MTSLKVLYTADEIATRLGEIGERIATDYKGEPLVLLAILKGAAFFLADLARAIPAPTAFEFVDVTTQPGERGEVVSLTYATHFNVSGRHVLILKDVFHSGITENYLMTHLSQQRPASIEIAALVDKPELRSVNLSARYAVFTDLPEGFLVGYGLGGDPAEHINRPDLCLLEG
ncbi:MAG: hypoxanthine phosphoribosyltransferase [Acidobacteria bacterium]|nr:hypoxanthine phosphoribosyltransferase [Acidobacteriota bacterium]